MKILEATNVSDKDWTRATKEDVNESIHDSWRSLAVRRSISEEQQNVTQDRDTFDNILALEKDKSHSHQTSKSMMTIILPADEEQVPDVTTPLVPNDEAARRLKKRNQGSSCCDGVSIRGFFIGLLRHCWMLIFSAFFAGAAFVLYYSFGNPKLDALPGTASLAWWCNWIAREFVLLEASRVLKFILLDCIILGSTYTVKIFGSFVTLASLQARGWPFALTAWGILNACFLQGDNAFQNHWLDGTGLEIYSLKANSGLHIISSEPYLRLLMCMIVAGVATGLKRTLLANWFAGMFNRWKYANQVLVSHLSGGLSSGGYGQFQPDARVFPYKKNRDHAGPDSDRGNKQNPYSRFIWEVDYGNRDPVEIRERGRMYLTPHYTRLFLAVKLYEPSTNGAYEAAAVLWGKAEGQSESVTVMRAVSFGTEDLSDDHKHEFFQRRADRLVGVDVNQWDRLTPQRDESSWLLTVPYRGFLFKVSKGKLEEGRATRYVLDDLGEDAVDDLVIDLRGLVTEYENQVLYED